MKEIFHQKLVRDRIPDIIEQNGQTCVFRELDEEAYQLALDTKLNEELHEYQESKSMEELADLLEVIHAVAKARGSSFEEVDLLRKEKAKKRGGFEKRIFLEKVMEESNE